MGNDIYIQAYRRGDVQAVNDLLKKQYPDDDDRGRMLEVFEDSGLWSVEWEVGEESRVTAFLGDDG